MRTSRKLLMLGTASLALAAVSQRGAYAAGVTQSISGTQTYAVATGNNNKITVETDGVVGGVAPMAPPASSPAAVEVIGDINAFANTIINNGEIDTTYATGIRIQGDLAGTVSSNTISNEGRIQSGEVDPYVGPAMLSYDGIVLESGGDINSNTITNTGLIDPTIRGSGDPNGIVIQNILKNGMGGISYGDITGNRIENHGQIYGYSGVKLSGVNSGNTVNAENDITSNTILNTGEIGSSDNRVFYGVYMENSASNATGEIASNLLTNEGAIYADDDGMHIHSRDALATNRIENNGVIDAYENAIHLLADDGSVAGNTIINSGRINSIDESIKLEGWGNVGPAGELYGNTIINSGDITAGFAASDGAIFLYSDLVNGVIQRNRIENSGSIVNTYGEGIYIEHNYDGDVTNNDIVNSGSITSSGRGVYIYGDDGVYDNRITNSGIIRSGDDGISLYADEDDALRNTIKNSGTIIASDGIYIYGDGAVDYNTVENTGLIAATDIAIEFDTSSTSDNNTIVVSGAVVGSNGAIDIQYGYNNHLDVSGQSFLGGSIDLRNDLSASIDLVANQSNTWTFDFSHTDFAGSLAATDLVDFVTSDLSFVFLSDGNNSVLATIDPTAVSANRNVLGANSTMVTEFFSFGQTQTPSDTKVETTKGPLSMPGQTKMWSTVSTTNRSVEGNGTTTLDHQVSSFGAAVGGTVQLDQGLSVLGFLGNTQTTTKADSRYSPSFDNTTIGFVGGLGLSGKSGVLSFGVDGSVGQQKHSNRRYINNNLALNDGAVDNWGIAGVSLNDYSYGQALAQAEFASNWYSLGANLSAEFAISPTMTFVPSLGARYSKQVIGGYSEFTNSVTDSGKVAVAEYDKQTVETLDLDLGMSVSVATGNGQLSFGGGYLTRQFSGSDMVTATFIGGEGAEAQLNGETLDLVSQASDLTNFYISFGYEMPLSGFASLSVNGRGVMTNDGLKPEISLGLGMQF